MFLLISLGYPFSWFNWVVVNHESKIPKACKFNIGSFVQNLQTMKRNVFFWGGGGWGWGGWGYENLLVGCYSYIHQIHWLNFIHTYSFYRSKWNPTWLYAGSLMLKRSPWLTIGATNAGGFITVIMECAHNIPWT